MNKKTITITMAMLSILLLVGGFTYAFYEWISGTNTDITFNVDGLKVIYNGGANITNANLIPTATKEEGVLKSIEIQLDSDQVISPTPTMSLYLDLTLFPSNLANSSFKWEVYKNDDTIALSTGTFENKQEGDTITLLNNQNVTSTKDTYKLYLWIDGSVDNDTNMQGQTYNVTVRATGSNALLAQFVDFDGILLLSNGEACSECSLTINSNPITTTTDVNGRYSFTNVPVGRHTIVAFDNTSTEVLNDSLEIKSGNNLAYNTNTLTTNIEKFYMKINITQSKTMGEVQTSDELIPLIVKVPGGVTCSLGDLNGDGRVRNDDSVIIGKIAINPQNYTDTEKCAADVDGNGFITAEDSTLVLKYPIGLITTFPAGAPLSQVTTLTDDQLAGVRVPSNATCNLGDVNGDGYIYSEDASTLQNIISNPENYTNTQKCAADVDGDGFVTNADNRTLLSFVAKLITVFPAGDPLSQVTTR